MDKIILLDGYAGKESAAYGWLERLDQLVPGVTITQAILVEFEIPEIADMAKAVLSTAKVKFVVVEHIDLIPKATTPAKPGANTMEEKMEQVEPLVEKKNGKVKDAIICDHCGGSFIPRRKDMHFCDKPECKKAQKAAYMKKYFEEKKMAAGMSGGKEEDGGIESRPTEEAAPQEEVLEDQIADLVYTDDRPWLIEDGPGKGSRISVSDLQRNLVTGSMKIGQHVRHSENGRHTVIKVTHGMGQKLERLFGEPMYILPAEL